MQKEKTDSFVSAHGLLALAGRDLILQRPIIIGVDVYPHYGSRGRFPGSASFAVAVLEETGDIRIVKRVSLQRLLGLVQRHRPAFLALDNVYELTQSFAGLQNLLSRLPEETRVVQVTGSPGEETSLQVLSERHGLVRPSRISPVEEAITCIRLVGLGVGSEVVAFEDETKVLVCREVSLGPGGSSQSRFRRKVHVSILTMTKCVEHALETARLDFDLFTEESDFGLERAEFTVYAPRAKLKGVVHSSKMGVVQVRIVPVCRSRIGFVPLNSKELPELKSRASPKIMVGIDPGTTCGLAILTLDGKPVQIESHRNLTRGVIVRVLADSGDPVLFAADVVPHPEFVAKLAKGFDATLFEPESLLSAVEKQEVARDFVQRYGLNLKDQHQRDALVAVVKAFNYYKAKFASVEDELRKQDLRIPVDEAKARIVKGYSIQRAIESLRPQTREQENATVEAAEPLTETEMRVQGLHEVLSFHKQRQGRLMQVNRQLNERTKELEEAVLELKSTLETERNREAMEIRRDRKFQVLQRENKTLRRELQETNSKLQKLEQSRESTFETEETSSGEMLLLKPLESFTKEGIEKTFRLFGLKTGDIVFSMDSSGGGVSTSNELVKRGVRAVVSQTNMAHQASEILEENQIPVLSEKDIRFLWVDGKPFVRKDEFERALALRKRRMKAEAAVSVEELLAEYKRDRLLSRA